MGTKRLTRVNELLRREVADMLCRALGAKDADFSTVTVTHVLTSPDLRRARVFVSIRGSEPERKEVLAALYRHRKEIQSKVNHDVKLKYTPRLTFQLDESLEEGDHVLGLINQLEAEHPDWNDADDHPTQQE